MNIKCLADGYCVISKNDRCYIYNEIYEAPVKTVLLLFAINLLLPEAKDYYIPVCIEFSEMKGKVIVEKDLKVMGNCKYQYFIARHQYETWKKAYSVIKCIFIMLCILLNLCFTLLLIKTNLNPIMCVCEAVIFGLCLGVALKIGLNNRKRKIYKIIDVKF